MSKLHTYAANLMQGQKWDSVDLKEEGSGVRLLGFETQLQHIVDVSPFTEFFTLFVLRFSQLLNALMIVLTSEGV